jgi:multiple sugar transport system permease protein
VTQNLLFAVATLIVWVGWAFAFRLVVLATQTFTAPDADRSRGIGKLGLTAGVAAIALVAGTVLMPHPSLAATIASGSGPQSTQAGAGWKFPIFWPAMPFTAWLAVTSIAMAATRAFQGGLSLNSAEKSERTRSAAVWIVVAIIGAWFYKQDPKNEINLLTGGIDLTPTIGAAVLVICTAATVAMVMAGREARSRGYAKSVVSQVALLAGSVVFGLPFVFLLITSLKEVKDMSSPNGIVWVPKVSKTVPYFDKKEPEYQAHDSGGTVIGNLVGKGSNGNVQLDILRPRSRAGLVLDLPMSALKEVPRDAAVVQGTAKGQPFVGDVIEEMSDGHRRVQFTSPPSLAGQQQVFAPAELTAVRNPGLNWKNYPDALEFLPVEADYGLVYLKNTLVLVVLGVLGTLLSSAIVAYAFSRMNFPGRNVLFSILLSTMMLPGAVTLLPQFLIFRSLGWIDTLYPLWVPAFFGSAFNIFLLRQFFMQIPMELEDAAKIDGCTYLKTFWQIMVPQIKPALAVIAIWTFMGAWNNFMGPLIYISSPEHMPLSYGLQLFNGDRGGDEPGLVMAFATMCMAPVLALFFFAQRYFIEGVTLSGFGGR